MTGRANLRDGSCTRRSFRAGMVVRRSIAAADAARPTYLAAVTEGHTEESGVFVGEAIGLIHDMPPVVEILARMTEEAEVLLRDRGPAFVA